MSAHIWTQLLLAALPGIATAILASYLAANRSLAKFYSERRWERKKRAYEEVIEALYNIVQYCEIMKEDYGGGAEYPAGKMKELQEKYTHAFWQLKKATDLCSLIMPPQAVTVLEELRDRPKLKWGESAPWDIYEQDYAWYRETLLRLVDVAKKELR